MRIAMFGHKRIPSREGGVEIVVGELAVRMTKKGHHVVCYNRMGHHVSGYGYDSELVKAYKGVTIKRVWTVQGKGLAAMTSSFFAAVLSSIGKYDVVHIHAEGPAAMCFLPKLFGKHVIVTIHGLDWQRGKWGGFAAKYIRFGEKQAVKNADEIIVLSRRVQEYFQNTYGRKTVYIPNGIERPMKYDADIINNLWGLKKDSYILFLGRIVPEKGISYLLDAWKGIATDKKLVIAGGASDTDAYMQELMKNVEENVVFTGFQQGRILEELYSNAYIYCLPSDLEGMPLSLLEAMSYGNCCVVSDIAECIEVIEDHGMTFPRGDVQKLKSLLLKLLDHPDIVMKYKNEASDFICNKYNWDDVVDKTLKVYDKR